MQLFWEKGYEATSVQDLVERIGINRFSLYDTFGSKHDLFLKALDRYRDQVVTGALRAMEESVGGLALIRSYFDATLRFVGSKQGWKGCLMTNSAVELSPRDDRAATKVEAHLKRLEDAFYRQLSIARRTGELKTKRKPRELARFLTGAAQGLGVLSKGAPGRRTLQSYVDTALSVLEQSSNSPNHQQESKR
jgi:TetR/AcrR family transcriptional repressor of nem operon